MALVNRNEASQVIGSKLVGATVDVAATIINKSKLTFGAKVVYTDGADTVTATVCTPSGKIKVYANADDIMKDFAEAAPNASNVRVTVGVDSLSPSVISLDPAAQLVREKVRNKASLDRQTAVVTKLDLQLTSIADYASGNSAQQAFYQKFAGERAVANALKTFYAALPQP